MTLSAPQLADCKQEHQREMEGLLENVRQLSIELRLQMLIIDSFIPAEFQVSNTCAQIQLLLILLLLCV